RDEERQRAMADDLHAALVDVVREAGQGESELLYARRAQHARLRAARAREEAEAEGRRRARDESADGDRRVLDRVLGGHSHKWRARAPQLRASPKEKTRR